MAKKFRERNLIVIALAGIVGTLLAIAGTFQVAKLSFIAGDTYTAYFIEAGGLQPGDPVKVAGSPVGKVTGVGLEGPNVKVTFTAKHVRLGDATTSQIKTNTLLGARYVNLVPKGGGSLARSTIPVARTTAPYSLTQELEDVSGTVGQVDTDQLAQALSTFSDTFRDTAGDIGPAMDGLTELSKTISSRDQAIRDLFAKAEGVTEVFRQRTQQITTLMLDGNSLIAELENRRDSLNKLLVNTTAVADQISGLVNDNNQQLKPALTELNATLELLRRNQSNIVSAVSRVSSFITGFGEGVASGPWFQASLDASVGAVPTSTFVPQVPLPAGEPQPLVTPNLPSLGDLLGLNGR